MQSQVCRQEQCPKSAWRRGLCSTHYARLRNKGSADADTRSYVFAESETCSIEDCDQPPRARGWCRWHYTRWREHGDPEATGKRAPAGTGYVNAHGYRVVRAPGHPNAFRGGQILEHRLLMSELLGRPLLRSETVHHVNGDKADNHIDGPLVGFRSGNLELWTGDQPAGQRVEDKVEYALAILSLYRPELLA